MLPAPAFIFAINLLLRGQLTDSHLEVQKILTLTFRYFFGSFLMAAIRSPSCATVLFMFSYNCLSFSNSPAVPSPFVQPRHELVEAVGHRVEPVEDRRVGHQLAGRPVAAVQLAGQLPEIARSRRSSESRERIVVQQLAETALAGVDPLGDRLRCSSARLRAPRPPSDRSTACRACPCPARTLRATSFAAATNCCNWCRADRR